MMNGIIVCPKCRATLIQEDHPNHECTPTYRIEGNILWVRWYDGKWHKCNLLSPEMKRPKKSPEDEREPKNCILPMLFLQLPMNSTDPPQKVLCSTGGNYETSLQERLSHSFRHICDRLGADYMQRVIRQEYQKKEDALNNNSLKFLCNEAF